VRIKVQKVARSKVNTNKVKEEAEGVAEVEVVTGGEVNIFTNISILAKLGLSYTLNIRIQRTATI
jgi:hypothetical protein